MTDEKDTAAEKVSSTSQGEGTAATSEPNDSDAPDRKKPGTRRRSPRPKPVRQRTAKGGYRHLSTDKPRRKPTKLEVYDRLDFIRHLMALGLSQHEIKKQFRAKFGGLAESTSREYLASARERLLRESNQPREAHITEALAFCREMRSDQSLAPRDRLKAQEVLIGLLGLNAPREFETHREPLRPIIPIVVKSRGEIRDFYAEGIDGVNVQQTDSRLLEIERLTHSGAGAMSDDALDAEYRRLADAEDNEARATSEAQVAFPTAEKSTHQERLA